MQHIFFKYILGSLPSAIFLENEKLPRAEICLLINVTWDFSLKLNCKSVMKTVLFSYGANHILFSYGHYAHILNT